jgi:hypothetical protein
MSETPHYKVGDIANGHRWTGTTWEPVGPAGQPSMTPPDGWTPAAMTAKKPWFKKWWGIGLIAFGVLTLLGIAFGGGADTDTTASDQPAATAEATEPGTSDDAPAEESEEPVEEPTEDAPEEPAVPTIPGSGTFEVGADIEPGLYFSTSDSLGYWARLKGATGELDDIIANGNPQGPVYVQISKNDKYFESNGMQDWVLVDPDAEGAQATSFPGTGMYMVGVDIKPGTYKATSEDGLGYWARMSGASGELDDIIANDNPQGASVVTIKSSDKFFDTNGMTEWVAE